MTGRVSFPVADIAGSPAFPETPDPITCILEQQWVDRDGGVQGAPEVGSRSQSPVVLSREDRVPGRGAGGGGDIGVVKENSFAGYSVERRCLYHRVAIDSCMGPSPIIGNGKQNIGWLIRFFLASGSEQGKHSQAKD